MAPSEGPPGDPQGMRPAKRRLEFGSGAIGEYVLANGKTVWLTWLATGQTHTHIVIWDEDAILGTENNVVRVQAAPTTERMLVQLES